MAAYHSPKSHNPMTFDHRKKSRPPEASTARRILAAERAWERRRKSHGRKPTPAPPAVAFPSIESRASRPLDVAAILAALAGRV